MSYTHLKSANAKASVLWLVCKYVQDVAMYAPDVLRIALQSFADEEASVKLLTLDQSILLWAHFEATQHIFKHKAALFFKYALALGSNDINVDVRDRARMLDRLATKYITNGESFTILKSLIVPVEEVAVRDTRFDCWIGSTSHILKSQKQEKRVPVWSTELVGQTERTEDIIKTSVTSITSVSNKTSITNMQPDQNNNQAVQTKEMTLDEFYASSEETEDSDYSGSSLE
jgi:AP-3 complex subunit beta